MTESSDRGSLRDRIVEDYSGYKMYDRDGEKLGKVEYTVLDRDGQPEYLGLKTGFFGSKTTLVPERIVRLNESGDFEVQATSDQVNDAPTLGDEDEVSPDFEDRILRHYSSGSESSSGTADQNRDYDNREQGQGYDDQAESRSGGGYDQGSDSERDYNRESSGSSSGAAAGGAAAGAAASGFRNQDTGDQSRSRDFGQDDRTEYRAGGETERQRGGSGSQGEEGKEKIRVTLKREEARAERIIDEDGEEEVRIRKKTIKEEVLVDIEDVNDTRR